MQRKLHFSRPRPSRNGPAEQAMFLVVSVGSVYKPIMSILPDMPSPGLPIILLVIAGKQQ